MDESRQQARELLGCILEEIGEEERRASEDCASEARIDPEGAYFYGGKEIGLGQARQIIVKWAAVLD